MAAKSKNKIITKGDFIEILYKFVHELFLKLLGANIPNNLKINVYTYSNKPAYSFNKGNVSKACDNILTRNPGSFAVFRVNINPCVNDRLGSRCTGLSVLSAHLSVKHPDHLFQENGLLSRIACLQDFKPNFVTHESQDTIRFFWLLDRILEIKPAINAEYIRRFWEKFRKKYEEITEEYSFNMDSDLSSWVYIPSFVIYDLLILDKPALEHYIRLYGYDFEESKIYPIESVDSIDSEPKIFRTKPYPIEKFFASVGYTPHLMKRK